MNAELILPAVMGLIVIFVVIWIITRAWTVATSIAEAGWEQWNGILFRIALGFVVVTAIILAIGTYAFPFLMDYVPGWAPVVAAEDAVNSIMGIFGAEVDFATDPESAETLTVPGQDITYSIEDGTPPVVTSLIPQTIGDTSPEVEEMKLACWTESTYPLVLSSPSGGLNLFPAGVLVQYQESGVGMRLGAPTYRVKSAQLGIFNWTGIQQGLGKSLRNSVVGDKGSDVGGTVIGAGPWPKWKDCPNTAAQQNINLMAPLNGVAPQSAEMAGGGNHCTQGLTTMAGWPFWTIDSVSGVPSEVGVFTASEATLTGEPIGTGQTTLCKTNTARLAWPGSWLGWSR